VAKGGGKVTRTLHRMISTHMGLWANACWWIGWRLWPTKCFSVVRSWATRQWCREHARRHEAAVRMLLASGWNGGYCYVDGELYTLKVYRGRKTDAIDGEVTP
jgi:hypothetical protein